MKRGNRAACLILLLMLIFSARARAAAMQVQIVPPGGEVFSVEIDSEETPADLMRTIEEQRAIPGEQQKLFFLGLPLKAGVPLKESGVPDRGKVYLELKITGELRTWIAAASERLKQKPDNSYDNNIYGAYTTLSVAIDSARITADKSLSVIEIQTAISRLQNALDYLNTASLNDDVSCLHQLVVAAGNEKNELETKGLIRRIPSFSIRELDNAIDSALSVLTRDSTAEEILTANVHLEQAVSRLAEDKQKALYSQQAGVRNQAATFIFMAMILLLSAFQKKTLGRV